VDWDAATCLEHCRIDEREAAPGGRQLARAADGAGTLQRRRQLVLDGLCEKTMTARRDRRKWSAKVTETSDALDLEADIFKTRSAKRIAASLKQSAEHSRRRRASPFQSAMSMLTFYINRAGANLSASQNRVLEAAKPDLRRLFGRVPQR
jgi:hypothetical protein